MRAPKADVVRGVFWTGGEKVLVQTVALAQYLILARLLAPSDFGHVAMLGVFFAIGGELADAWDRFTDQLRLDDFFFSGGILSLSFTFVPMLLFRVVGSAYRLAENVYVKLSNQFGFHDDTLSALQSYTDEMRQKRQERGV